MKYYCLDVRWTRVAMLATFAAASHLLGDCTLTNLGITPINDLGPGLYKGYAGGLYPNGANTRPGAHEAAGLNIATNLIQPLTAVGNVDTTNGKIGLLSIGMSN